MSQTERPRLSAMKLLDSWHWRYFDAARGEWAITPLRLGEVDAKLQLPDGAEKVEGSLMSRWVPDD